MSVAKPQISHSGSPSLHIAYIGLGSNLASHAGVPAVTLAAAIERLAESGEVTARSSLYDTEPVGYTQQPRFINAVVAFNTTLNAEALLDELLAIERSFGRNRASSIPKGPRILDLDLLLLDDLVFDSPHLTLPHPALAERKFVLIPLAEIAPDVVHPKLGKTIATLLASLPNESESGEPAIKIPWP